MMALVLLLMVMVITRWEAARHQYPWQAACSS
jgi:hypothetical protein